VERSIFIGVLSEISMRAKILKDKLREDPNSVFEVLSSIEKLEDELLLVVSNFDPSRHK